MKDMKGYLGVSILHARHVLHSKTKKGAFMKKAPFRISAKYRR